MPVIIEKFDSGSATVGPDSPSVDLLYAVIGSESDLDVRALVEATIPAICRGMVFQNYHIEHKGGGIWDVSVRYGRLEGEASETPETGDPPAQAEDTLGSSYSFETSGGTQHITQSLQTVGRYGKPGKNPPDLKGTIGFNNDSVEGCDITVPVFRFTITHAIPVALVTFGYAVTLFQLTGKVNNAPFKGFAAGEVLFLGASGQRRDSEKWEISFAFTASPNTAGLQVGDIAGIAKKGWEYLWVRYADVEDQKVLVKQPESVHVERVYDSANFALLGIGV
ncbi:MAG: hypothetical protein LC104_07860 [Bacteroidales bacterium]|nr:hypothetical protein [Bacteroidales bacterium]